MGNYSESSRPYRWIGDYNKIHVLRANLNLNPEFVIGDSILHKDPNDRRTLNRMFMKLESRLRDPEFLRHFVGETDFFVPEKYEHHFTRDGQVHATDAVFKVRVRRGRGRQIDFRVEHVYENLAEKVKSRGVQEYLKRLKRLEAELSTGVA